jgi:hypothetical protein
MDGRERRWGHSVRRSIITAIALAATATVGTGAWVATRPDTKTPCEASRDVIAGIREQAHAGELDTVAYMGVQYGSMLRGIAAGQYQDVEGPIPPELRSALTTVAADLEGMPVRRGSLPGDEFDVGTTGVHMAAVLAECRR